MTTISSSGGTIFIRQNVDSIQYQINSTSGAWTTISSWPVTLINTPAPSSGNILTVKLYTDITISATTVGGTGTNGYFSMGSQYIIFDGNGKTATISGVIGYFGLIQNSDGYESGYANVTVQNVGILSSGGSTLQNTGGIYGGWVCQQYFSSFVNNNIVTNCYSIGQISARSGGICGQAIGYQGGSVTISNCYSTGAISGQFSGGICGFKAGEGGSVTISNCYSTGAISGQSSGGICGFNAGLYGSVTITNCYSTGTITAEGSGGICGASAGEEGSVTITGCYSPSAISGEASGGICGSSAGLNGIATITNCYSTGIISGSQSGGICGSGAGVGGPVTITNSYSIGAISGSQTGGICGSGGSAVTITNCYSYGNFTTPTNSFIPGMVGVASVTTGITNFYVARASWLDSSAKAAGALTGTPTSLYVDNPGTTWTTLAENTPYYLTGNTSIMYTPNSYTNPSGNYNSPPGLYTDKTYSILSVNNAPTPSSITINSVTGVISYNSKNYPMNTTYVTQVYAQVIGYEYGYAFGTFTLTQILCFKEGSKILYLNPETNSEEYIKIENLRKGDLVKTSLNGYKPITFIGYSKMYNKVDDKRTKDKLYKCCKEEYPEIFEDLVLTATHCILVDNFVNDEQRQQTLEVNGDIYVTEKKYRLPACVDYRTKIYEVEGEHTIYHLALEHVDYYKNYGVYANGLLVETSSNRMMAEYGMTLL